MPNRARLISLGWKQGVLLSSNNVALEHSAPYQIAEGTRLLLVSQTCDLVQGSFEREPYFEVLSIHPLGKEPSGEYQGGKNSRRIEFSLCADNQISHWYALPYERQQINRELLLDGRKPDFFLEDENVLEMILRWLSRRYTRTAFPETFVNRINSKRQPIAKKFAHLNPYISSVYIRLNPFAELEETSAYSVEVILVMEADKFDDPEQHKQCSKIKSQLEEQLEKCDGIDVSDINLESTASLTFEDVKGFREWDYSYLSFRDPENAAPPIVS